MNKRNFLKIISLTFFYSIFLQIPSNSQSSYLKKKEKKFKKNLSNVWLLDINDY
tara:strand:+ start:4917 stop:5078 length:162 start_codon:yes stop_codon:yes gene_type:complete